MLEYHCDKVYGFYDVIKTLNSRKFIKIEIESFGISHKYVYILKSVFLGVIVLTKYMGHHCNNILYSVLETKEI